MPQYLFLLHGDENAYAQLSEEEMGASMAEYGAFDKAVAADGAKILGGEALQPTTTATVVRTRADADPLVTDGPFAELKEALGGYYLIEVSDLDQAIRLAAICPTAAVEVRPIWDVSGT